VRTISSALAGHERVPVLGKYQSALRLAGVEPFDDGRAPFQDVESLVKLRDALVHYKPEWHNVESQPHHKREARLRGKFPLNCARHAIVITCSTPS
jgi:hypothetical protein